MRSVPERPPVVTFAACIGGFVAGPLLGLQLGARLAPDSELAQVASVFAFPVAFFIGIFLWLGLGFVSVVVGGLWRLLRGRIPSAASLDTTETLVPPGYGAFVVTSLGLTSAAGLVVGLLSELPLGSALAIYGLAGALYGAGLWLLAHHGYLPFPEPS